MNERERFGWFEGYEAREGYFFGVFVCCRTLSQTAWNWSRSNSNVTRTMDVFVWLVSCPFLTRALAVRVTSYFLTMLSNAVEEKASSAVSFRARQSAEDRIPAVSSPWSDRTSPWISLEIVMVNAVDLDVLGCSNTQCVRLIFHRESRDQV